MLNRLTFYSFTLTRLLILCGAIQLFICGYLAYIHVIKDYGVYIARIWAIVLPNFMLAVESPLLCLQINRAFPPDEIGGLTTTSSSAEKQVEMAEIGDEEVKTEVATTAAAAASSGSTTNSVIPPTDKEIREAERLRQDALQMLE